MREREPNTKRNYTYKYMKINLTIARAAPHHKSITIDYKACWTLFIKYTPTTHIQREKECM